MNSLMNAAVLTGYGGLDKLICTQVSKAIPQKGEVLIKVGACSINNTDINVRTGWYAADSKFQEILQDRKENNGRKTTWNQNGIEFPRIQGADVVGRVINIGESVDTKILNKRVIVDPWVRNGSLIDYKYIGSEFDGGFAEYVSVPSANVYPINSSLSDIELATLPCSYSTAENMITKGRVSDQDTVLIMGASGGVGSAAIQLCKIRGAKVIAVVGKKKECLAKNLGADYVYCRNKCLKSNLSNHQITVGLDVVGGDYFNIIFKSLEVGGRYVTAGSIAGPIVELDLRDLIYKDIEMIGASRFEKNIFKNLIKYIESRLLNPPVAKVFKLNEIRKAQSFFQKKDFFGKVVISLDN